MTAAGDEEIVTGREGAVVDGFKQGVAVGPESDLETAFGS